MPTTFAFRNISPVIFNESYRYKTYPLDAGETFVKGAPAVLDDGVVAETGANPAAILGFFTADADQYDWKEDTFGHVEPAVPVALATGTFRGTMSHATGTVGGVAFTWEWDPDVIGDTFGITENADGVWVVDAEKDAANQRVVVLGVDDEVEADDINPPVIFAVLPANRQVVV